MGKPASIAMPAPRPSRASRFGQPPRRSNLAFTTVTQTDWTRMAPTVTAVEGAKGITLNAKRKLLPAAATDEPTTVPVSYTHLTLPTTPYV